MVKTLFVFMVFAFTSWAEMGTSPVIWDRETLRCIAPDGLYGRMVRLANGTFACVCEYHGSVQFRQRRDQGRTWSPAQTVATWSHGVLANPELLELRDGTLLCFHNRRPRKNGQGGAYAIALSRRNAGSETWSESRVVYTAGDTFQDGCWEPAAIQLPSNEIQLFFANESPYRTSNEQEISLLRSLDGGLTWSAPECVGFRQGHRDGMPVPVLLANNAGIAVAIEDNGLNGPFKPAILFSTLQDSWRSGMRTGDSSQRWSALHTPLPASTYAGAPYLRQWNATTTVLSFQQSASGNMKQSRLAVCLGTATAQSFSGCSYPFPETAQPQLWGSLCIHDARTVTILATLTMNGQFGVWSIEGHLPEPASNQ